MNKQLFKVITFAYDCDPIEIEVHDLESQNRETAWEQVEVEMLNTNMQAVLLDEQSYKKLKELLV